MLGFKTEDSLWLKAKQTMQILTKEIEEKTLERNKRTFEAEQKVKRATKNKVTKVLEMAVQFCIRETLKCFMLG